MNLKKGQQKQVRPLKEGYFKMASRQALLLCLGKSKEVQNKIYAQEEEKRGGEKEHKVEILSKGG